MHEPWRDGGSEYQTHMLKAQRLLDVDLQSLYPKS
jgi:hypothetical protein